MKAIYNNYHDDYYNAEPHAGDINMIHEKMILKKYIARASSDVYRVKVGLALVICSIFLLVSSKYIENNELKFLFVIAGLPGTIWSIVFTANSIISAIDNKKKAKALKNKICIKEAHT